MPEETARDMFVFSQATAPAPEREMHLIDRVRSGDQEAFGEMYRAYAPLVHGVVLARVRLEEVQDIVQDVFLAAYKNLHKLRDKDAVAAWLVKIARNRAAEHYRQARPAEELNEDISGKRDKRAEAAEIMREIRSLPDAYRETLILRLVEGMTGHEIAERTGLKPESVRVNLHRGMDMLRQRLGIGAGK